ncbi:hypothetical protein F4553_007975 [Allocatelliglobosispora scoriae]|uniref:Uncharacterized protein n=1 Tax=Allocatelliglobosispora scoriae TaxID=643052 RepID=A0A841C6Y0_9ACTN|nr:hypothetical protein [Allocatelliglobosispora scoriae]MBB5874541.1 hypothetical protein [Allocatelliglobosispora scoriae]
MFAGGALPFADVKQSKQHGAPLAVVFISLIPLAFSEVFLEALCEVLGRTEPWWGLLALDLGLLSLMGVLIWGFDRRPVAARPRQIRWWVAGAALTLVLDGIETLLEFVFNLKPGQNTPLWTDILLAAFYLVSLAVMLAAIVGASPVALLRPRVRRAESHQWRRLRSAIPLLLGTAAGYAGGLIWDRALNNDDRKYYMDGAVGMCSGAVSQEYFAQLSQVIPLLLVAVGLEAGLFRHMLHEPVQRAMTAMTVIILCAGEALAISTLPWTNARCGDTLQGWHEYVAFILTLEACSVALASLVWAVTFRSPEPRDRRGTPVLVRTGRR